MTYIRVLCIETKAVHELPNLNYGGYCYNEIYKYNGLYDDITTSDYFDENTEKLIAILYNYEATCETEEKLFKWKYYGESWVDIHQLIDNIQQQTSTEDLEYIGIFNLVDFVYQDETKDFTEERSARKKRIDEVWELLSEAGIG